jgi:phage FluMu protein Com
MKRAHNLFLMTRCPRCSWLNIMNFIYSKGLGHILQTCSNKTRRQQKQNYKAHIFTCAECAPFEAEPHLMSRPI